MIWAGIIGDKLVSYWTVPDGIQIIYNGYSAFMEEKFKPC